KAQRKVFRCRRFCSCCRPARTSPSRGTSAQAAGEPLPLFAHGHQLPDLAGLREPETATCSALACTTTTSTLRAACFARPALTERGTTRRLTQRRVRPAGVLCGSLHDVAARTHPRRRSSARCAR